MSSGILRGAFFSLLGLFAAGTIALNLAECALLQRQIAVRKIESEKTARARADNQRLRSLVQAGETDQGTAARAMTAETERLRQEVGQLEQKARDSFEKLSGQRAADSNSLQNGTDPEQGLVRLEVLRNSGRATPAAAAQTFVWAAFHGENETLTGMFRIEDAALPQARAIVAGLSESDRARFPTAERIAAVVFGDAYTTASAVHIASVSLTDPAHAVVEVRTPGATQKVPLQLGPDGWQIVLNAGFIGRLDGWVKARTQPGKN